MHKERVPNYRSLIRYIWPQNNEGSSDTPWLCGGTADNIHGIKWNCGPDYHIQNAIVSLQNNFGAGTSRGSVWLRLERFSPNTHK